MKKMNNIDNILNANNTDLTEDLLLKYVEGKLPKEAAYSVEKAMANSQFVNDAVEGLENFKNKKNIQQLIEELNSQLQKQTIKPKIKREKRKIKFIDGILIAVIIVLILSMLGYAVIHAYNKAKPNHTNQKIVP